MKADIKMVFVGGPLDGRARSMPVPPPVIFRAGLFDIESSDSDWCDPSKCEIPIEYKLHKYRRDVGNRYRYEGNDAPPERDGGKAS